MMRDLVISNQIIRSGCRYFWKYKTVFSSWVLYFLFNNGMAFKSQGITELIECLSAHADS